MDAVDLESEWHLLARKVIYDSLDDREDPADVQRLEKLSAVEMMRDLGSGMRLGAMLSRDS